MRILRWGVGAAAILSAIACGTSDEHAASAPEAALTLAELPVRLTSPWVAGTFEQAIDHGTETAPPAEPVAAADAGAPVPTTFTQRYWYNPAFRTGPGSPVLFYLCGESECSASYGNALNDSARTLGASIVVLEHRYYGASVPFGQPDVAQMQHLTIHNALEDAAAFERYAVATHDLGGKWIAAGGSYPGMLAAFYRLKHPELVAGAWASSAPIAMKLLFPEFDTIASRTLGPECAMLTRQAQAQIDKAFAEPAAKKTIIESFYGPQDDAFIASMTSPLRLQLWVRGIATRAAQYGKQQALCSSLAQHETDPLTGFFEYTSPTLADDPAPPDAGAPITAETPELRAGGDIAPPAMPDVVDPVDAPASPAPLPAWTYQTCREVGFFLVASADRTQSITPSGYDEAYFASTCQKTFGIQPDIAATRATYLDPIMAGKASNIFFVNGSDDPWSTISPLDPSNAPPGTDVFVVRNGSHCADLANLVPGMPAGIYEAHLKFNELARSWLAAE